MVEESGPACLGDWIKRCLALVKSSFVLWGCLQGGPAGGTIIVGNIFQQATAHMKGGPRKELKSM